MHNSNFDDIFSVPIDNAYEWSFDERVAKVFPNMIKRSIPGYSTITKTIGIFAEYFIKPNTRIYDLGCSLATVTLSVLQKTSHLNCKIIAVDKSHAMIKRCFNNINNANLRKESLTSVDIVEGDIINVDIKNASMVILNFTLQFLAYEDKYTLLSKIYSGLNSGGVLILSEKFSFKNKKINELLFNMHRSFKLDNGYSELEVNQKNNVLKNVMFTDSIETHKSRLRKIGFSNIELWFQYLNFGSLIAFKDEKLI